MSELKRSRDSSQQSDQSDSNSSHFDEGATTKKKTRQELNNTTLASTEINTTEKFDNKIRTAIDLNHAIKQAFKMHRSIGYSPTTYEEKNPPRPEDQTILEDLRSIHEAVPLPYKHNSFQEKFRLTIKRPNYEYEGEIGYQSVDYKTLREWFENGTIAGYGDVKTLETKVDPEVRDAREILASEFTVDPTLIERVRVTWAEGFIPGNVRVEPYKIQLYGGGGHFKAHRDTPEDGLVGTFLVGLGDTSSGEGHFRIGNLKLRSNGGSWVAFHPDVPHSVERIWNWDYRAVLAFKIFRDGDPVEHERATREAALQQRVGAIINKIPAPYGILLEHRYHMGVQGLNGFDAILLSAAEQRRGTAIHVFPVLISTHSEVYYDSDDEGYENTFYTKVIPFTESHVNILLQNTSSDLKEAALSQIKHFSDLKDVPFYSRTFGETTDRWQEEKEEIDFTGNESNGERESSIYLSYALLVLPNETRES